MWVSVWNTDIEEDVFWEFQDLQIWSSNYDGFLWDLRVPFVAALYWVEILKIKIFETYGITVTSKMRILKLNYV